jgi:hypothetical protein
VKDVERKIDRKRRRKKGGRISDDALRKKERKERRKTGTEWNDAVVEIKKK